LGELVASKNYTFPAPWLPVRRQKMRPLEEKWSKFQIR